MSRPAVAIPEKLFFKIGEVCELAGVQAHVLRYWESEFPMLAPQKNRAGQRVYRKRESRWRCGSKSCFTKINTRSRERKSD
jgi:hypothetical protein